MKAAIRKRTPEFKTVISLREGFGIEMFPTEVEVDIAPDF